MTKPDTARFVWYDRNGAGRNLYGMFRLSLTLDSDVREAVLHLFADTYYQLFVNGEFIEYGPVRFDPRFPLYDTHDIAKRLKPGPNAIAVLVNHFGHKTFKAMPCRPGFVAWGNVQLASGRSIDLTTRTGVWRARESRAFLYAPKISFALNAADRYDQSREERGWTGLSFDDSGWATCVEVEPQDAWGALAPRSIPFMTGAEVPIHAVVNVLPLAKTEDRYSFTVPAPNHAEIHSSAGREFVAFSTWVYSPSDQTVPAGVFWSESWLNGRMVDKGLESPVKPMRITQRWQLTKGWNHYGGVVGLYQDIVDQYIALPAGTGLVVSAVKDSGSPVVFRRSRIFSESECRKPWPFAPEERLDEVGGWIDVTRTETAQCPCRETSWDEYSDPIETLHPRDIEGHVFRRGEYPHGFALLLDIDHMHLAFPRIRARGVAGATIDLTYSESLTADSRHLEHSHNYSGGDRVLCAHDDIDFQPSHPKGMRYLKVTVRAATRDVTLGSVSVRAARYPVEYRGRFRCSDPALTAIWDMGRRTQAANMEDAYVDCSGRERGMYLRDSIIQYHANLAAFGDQALMHRCMQLYGQSPDATGKFRAVYPNDGDYTIADFALNALEGYRAYYEHTGDIERVRNDWDAILGNLQWFHALADQRDDLLLDAEWDKKSGVKAHYGGFHGDLSIVRGHMDNSGVHCVFSCTYLIALQAAVLLARALGKSADAESVERRVAILSRTIPEKFWDPSCNRFSDNLECSTHSVHANLFAVRAGLVSGERLNLVKSYVARQLQSLFVNGYDPSAGTYTSPSFAFYILDGLYRAGLTRTAEDLMRAGWGWALAQGFRTCPEYWTRHGSHCHAWSASPTYYLSKHLLGVHYPMAPDLSVVEIRVQAESVTDADGAFPHPNGVIEVKWHTENGTRVFDHVRAPGGVKVTVVG